MHSVLLKISGSCDVSFGRYTSMTVIEELYRKFDLNKCNFESCGNLLINISKTVVN